MATLTLTMAFLMGLTGSLHCAGMCGPIMWILPFHFFTGAKKAIAIALYHLGRISVYACLAVVLHSFRNLFDPQVQQYISVVLGVSLLLLGIFSFIPIYISRFKLPWAGFVKQQLSHFVGKPGLGALTITGILNGLLPCGLVYMALSASITTSSTIQAVIFMYAFGVGTMPMLLSIILLKNKLVFLRGNQARKLVPVVVFVFGCLFILRGMNMGIPYLSPKVEVSQHEIRSCCHKHP